jgi:hypothetical protein
MTNSNPQPAAWLIKDRQWKWKFKKLQGRIERWHSKYYLIPTIDIDWELGMFTVGIIWLNWAVSMDFDFDPEYDASKHEAEYPG